MYEKIDVTISIEGQELAIRLLTAPEKDTVIVINQSEMVWDLLNDVNDINNPIQKKLLNFIDEMEELISYKNKLDKLPNNWRKAFKYLVGRYDNKDIRNTSNYHYVEFDKDEDYIMTETGDICQWIENIELFAENIGYKKDDFKF